LNYSTRSKIPEIVRMSKEEYKIVVKAKKAVKREAFST
jgi:hypothetical protein